MALLEDIKNNFSSFLKVNDLAVEESRNQNLNKVLEKGFPTKKDEEYKYTDLSEITSKDFGLAVANYTSVDLSSFLISKEFDRIVFVNGKYVDQLSKISNSDLEFLNLKEAKNHPVFQNNFDSISDKDRVFTQLNNTYTNEGVFLYVPKNVVVENPIQVLYLSTEQSQNVFYTVRNLLVAEQGAKIEVIETHHNLDNHFVFTNSLTEIFVAANASADWHKLQNDTENTYLVDQTFVKQDRDSLATVNTFAFGGKLVRNNLDFIHNGENINSFMNGVTVIGGEQLVDHHTAVHHNTPNCESYQNYKGVFNDKAHGVFNGKVFVNKVAQKTNAYQQNNNILLSQGASIDTKPQLEIFADDVKCSHGCTVGQLDSESLWYLRARGIPKKEAEALLLYAFANDAIDKIQIEALADKVSKLLAQKIGVDIEF